MSKKILSICLSLAVIFTVTACGNPDGDKETPTTTKNVDNTTVVEKEEAETPTENAKYEGEKDSTDEIADTEEDDKGETSLDYEGPYIVTTCGQSPGAVQIAMAAKMVDAVADSDNTLVAADLDTDKYKTLIVTTGTSMKGMGAAGTNVDAEIERCVELIEKAKDAGLKVICAHVEGMARRTDSSDAESIEAILPLSDYILIIEDSNSDGYFTEYSEKNDMPLIEVKDAINIGDVLK